ncbi:MAG: hypothetical protein ACRDJW_14765 [Thermomicrobiales bacterium]
MRRPTLLIAMIGMAALLLGSVGTGAAMPAAADLRCTDNSVGSVPLTDLGNGTYQGYPGGLYPDGTNEPPVDYVQEGLMRSQAIQPLNGEGLPDRDGRIVLLSIGMSNTTREFSGFQDVAAADPAVNPQLMIVDGAQGGWDATKAADPTNRNWIDLDQRMDAAGATDEQVQVIWLKEAIAREDRAFPADAEGLRDDLRTIVQNLQERYPNLQIIYLSSRTYAGYATKPLNPEPYAYQGGFAVKWLIEERIEGDATGPWLAWGPYLWTDGINGRSDGLVWTCADVRKDGTHPSESGVDKVAGLLLEFFKTDETAKSWFLA